MLFCAAVKRLVSENRLPHLLLYGPPGTGKTSTILAVARQMYPRQSIAGMVLELNASDDRGIGIVRQEIQDFVSTRTVFRWGAAPCACLGFLRWPSAAALLCTALALVPSFLLLHCVGTPCLGHGTLHLVLEQPTLCATSA